MREPLWPFALAAACLLAIASPAAAQRHSLRVMLDVEWEDTTAPRERRIRDQLVSHVRREFRALGDVEVLEWDEGWGAKKLYEKDAGVAVLGFYARQHGIVLLTGAWTACPGMWALYYDAQEYWDLASRWSQEGKDDASRALFKFVENCKVQNYRKLHISPASDMATIVRGIVASIDNEVLEPLRQDLRPTKLRIP